MNLTECSAEDLWKFVGGHLNQRGIDTVLVGGSVVSIYTRGAYVSGDLDFIVTTLFANDLESAMSEIGFKKSGRHFTHPACHHLFVEFPKGPLGIGEDIDIVPVEQNENGQTFKILSPTDCIKDRLASYIYFKTRDTLDQAVLVGQNQPFKLNEVKRWCSAEGADEAYAEFKDLLKGGSI